MGNIEAKVCQQDIFSLKRVVTIVLVTRGVIAMAAIGLPWSRTRTRIHVTIHTALSRQRCVYS